MAGVILTEAILQAEGRIVDGGQHRAKAGSEARSLPRRKSAGDDAVPEGTAKPDFYRPNWTVTRAPAATWVPAAGVCWRATPLPTASSSNPIS